MNYFLSAIPLWVYVVIVILVTVPLFYYFGPVIIGIWNVMPKWLKITLGAIVSAFGIFAYGRHKGYKDVKAHDDELNKKAVQNREKIHDDVQKLNPADTDKRLSRWMRD